MMGKVALTARVRADSNGVLRSLAACLEYMIRLSNLRTPQFHVTRNNGIRVLKNGGGRVTRKQCVDVLNMLLGWARGSADFALLYYAGQRET